ncbi:MAG: NAD(P)/FAD-dependent oxidoreductase [Flavobacteriales bacterium]|nr:NAD(P)/FAD-dependent oxidoreductase [Flavobacteriales bacterium]
MESTGPSDLNSNHIVIIGTGFAGICMGIKLLEAGIQDFVILERSTQLGGTWRDNTYPGAACDVVSHLYSFSFEPNPNWSRMFAQQKEILDYTVHCVEKYGLRPYIRFGKEVTGGTFDAESSKWHIHLKDGSDVTGNIWVNGMGPLNRAVMPDIPGLDSFRGEVFHSSHWQHDCNLTNKHVSVIGTGASAIQIVPNIAKQVKALHVHQRSAAWVIRKPDRPMRSWEKRMFRSIPRTQRIYRGFYYWLNELTVIALAKHPSLTRFIRKMAEHHMNNSGLTPELKARLTPKYTIGCKRILPSNDFYPTFLFPHVHLHNEGIERIGPNAIVGRDGSRTEVDVIILATGFEAAEFPSSFKVQGIDGQLLADVWKDGPEAYLGTTVCGFPNMFFIIGPNTGLGHSSMILMIEAQVRYIISCIHELEHQGATRIEVRPEVQNIYNQEIQRRLAATVWNSGCSSWYRTGAGKNTSLWPGHTFEFMSRTCRVTVSDYLWS